MPKLAENPASSLSSAGRSHSGRSRSTVCTRIVSIFAFSASIEFLIVFSKCDIASPHSVKIASMEYDFYVKIAILENFFYICEKTQYGDD